MQHYKNTSILKLQGLEEFIPISLNHHASLRTFLNNVVYLEPRDNLFYYKEGYFKNTLAWLPTDKTLLIDGISYPITSLLYLMTAGIYSDDVKYLTGDKGGLVQRRNPFKSLVRAITDLELQELKSLGYVHTPINAYCYNNDINASGIYVSDTDKLYYYKNSSYSTLAEAIYVKDVNPKNTYYTYDPTTEFYKPADFKETEFTARDYLGNCVFTTHAAFIADHVLRYFHANKSVISETEGKRIGSKSEYKRKPYPKPRYFSSETTPKIHARLKELYALPNYDHDALPF